MRIIKFCALFILASAMASAQVIDMHMHSYTEKDFSKPGSSIVTYLLVKYIAT